MEYENANDIHAVENARVKSAWREANTALRKSEGMRVLFQRAYTKERKLVKRIYKKCERNPTGDEERIKISKDIVDMKSRLEFYRHEQYKYSWSSEERTTQELHTQVHLEAFAKLACQRACNEFFTSPLPRELRDMVYDFIIGDMNVKLDPALIRKLSAHSSPMNWEDYTFDPWCWSEDFMGPDVFGEYMERWFAINEFTIDRSILYLIPDLVKCPRPSLNIDPAALISSIVVVLRYPEHPWRSGNAVPREFHNLLEFKRRIHIKLEIEVRGRYSEEIFDYGSFWRHDIDHIEKVVGSLNQMFPTLCQLKGNGSCIEAIVNDECVIDSENSELSEEGWVKRIMEFIKFRIATQVSDTDSSLLDNTSGM